MEGGRDGGREVGRVTVGKISGREVRSEMGKWRGEREEGRIQREIVFEEE